MSRITRLPSYLPAGSASYSPDAGNRSGRASTDAITLIVDDHFTQAVGALTGKQPDTVNEPGNSYTTPTTSNLNDGTSLLTAAGTATPGNNRLIVFNTPKSTGKILVRVENGYQGFNSASNDFARIGFLDAAITYGVQAGYERANNRAVMYEGGTAVDSVTAFPNPLPSTSDYRFDIEYDLDTGLMTFYDGSQTAIMSYTMAADYRANREIMFIVLGRSADNKFGRVRVWTGATISDV